MKNKTLFLLLLIPLVLLTAGCDPDCTTTEYATFDVILDGPADGEIVSSLTPSLSWHHNESCTPEKFVVLIYDPNGIDAFPTSGLNSFLSPNSALQPGGAYNWLVYPFRTSPFLQGKYSDARIFFTGPICAGDPLIAPELKLPEENGWIRPSSSHKFKWYYPGNCLPTSYTYEFVSDPNFVNILKSGVTSNHYQHLYETFPNCSTVFWRVAANDGTSTGPWSDVFDFHWGTDTSCWQNHLISLDSAIIYGNVYHDKCPQTSFYVPLDNQFVLDPKCKMTGGIGIHANGLDDPGEQGLSDVRVDLGVGPCPSTGLDYQDISYGNYKFTVLTPGEYCISISNQQTSSTYETGDLTKGIWTEPLTNQDVTGVTITLEDGYHEIKQNFGWDKFEQLFAMFELEENTNCRVRPAMDSHVEAIILAGDSVPLIGQVAESDWKLAVVGEKLCYLYLPGIYDLPLVDPPPEPIPTPKAPKPSDGEKCSDYTTRETCPAPQCKWDPAGTGKCIDN